jgi:catechol 2,3-dioxygenase-like lactoylglutathione lyase family enzyme
VGLVRGSGLRPGSHADDSGAGRHPAGGRGSVLGLDHVQLAAPRGREDDARAFYGGLLGLRELEKPPVLRARGGVWFACGAQQLHLGVEEPFSAARKAHPALAVDDLDALAERLAGAGVEVTWDDAIPGARRFYAADPFGNRLELLSPAGGPRR